MKTPSKPACAKALKVDAPINNAPASCQHGLAMCIIPSRLAAIGLAPSPTVLDG
ncbi:hypothetical protein CC2G_014006 [Coprinopsis cinerea AmutBmut pab1-1]|nr:hypothetical protein CC2G_014006 [Coprinopsis cinerea AmutBmut pab1-1]